MTESAASATPTAINLHKKSRLLEIAFADGSCFRLSSEYLRVFAAASAGQRLEQPVHNKQGVDITGVEMQGTAALRVDFDDDYSGSLSWDALYELGANYERNWQAYLQTLADHKLQRGGGRATGNDGKVSIRLLYFIQLAEITGRDEEDVDLPATVTDVETLLAWLRNREPGWQAVFADDKVQVAVNKHFAEPYTRVEHGDEVAIVPRPE